jgi:WASH complex subunit CCDC53
MATLTDPGKLHDLKVCNPIPHRKVLVMINQFVVTTTRFLNRFANLCDDKLSAVSSDISKLQTTLAILEAKLASVPGLDAAATAADTSAVPDVAPEQPAAISATTTTPAASSAPPPPPISSGPPAKEDPSYMAYFKLIRLGMPLEQVKLKCQAEGNDPNVLDHPDQPIATALLALPDASGAGTAAAAPSSTAIVTSPDGAVTPGEGAIVVAEAAPAEEEVNVMKIKEDPMYSKYFKMLMVGIPKPVVGHKMTMDGLDPSLLDLSPNSPSPNA